MSRLSEPKSSTADADLNRFENWFSSNFVFILGMSSVRRNFLFLGFIGNACGFILGIVIGIATRNFRFRCFIEGSSVGESAGKPN